MRTAICSGSFDPITLGHLDVIRRAAGCFDQVWVCVSPNAEKRNQMFTPEQKLQMVRAAIEELPNVEAELWPGLLADFAKNHGACAIVRGVRCVTDFDGEYQMAQINRGICSGLETLLLPASAPYNFRYRQPLERYLPGPVIPLVEELAEKEGGSNHGQ